MSVQKFLYGLFIDFWQKSFSFSISKWTVYLPTQHKKNFSLYAGKGGRDGMNGDIFFF